MYVFYVLTMLRWCVCSRMEQVYVRVWSSLILVNVVQIQW
jgi:hypothetical protein